jgi:hypothetical protein
MNFWDSLKDQATKRAKAPVLRELDRAIGKAETGQTAAAIVPQLKSALLTALRGKLPDGIGEMLLDIVLAGVNWDDLAKKPSADLGEFLRGLRKRVEGARL